MATETIITKESPEIEAYKLGLLEQAKNLVIKRQLDLKSSKMLRDMLNEATVEYK